MALMSPTKNGTMRKDQYWALAVDLEKILDNPYVEDCKVEIVEAKEVEFDVWRYAPAMTEHFKKIGIHEKWIGRRINDNVELFDHGAEEEFADLRASLEQKGLAVRSFVAQSTSNKFPKLSHKAVMGGEKNTLMKKIMENLTSVIEIKDVETGKTFDHGIIADFPGQTKSLFIARVTKESLAEVSEEQAATITAYHEITGLPVKCQIIGEIRDSKPNFYCDEESVKLYFDSLGRVHDFALADYVEKREQEEKEAMKKQKKEAKKHRRQRTASTLTSPTSENSFTSLNADNDDTVKARQREKNNAKRKAQRERRRAGADESAPDTANAIADHNDKQNATDTNDLEGPLEVVRKLGSRHELVKDKNGKLATREIRLTPQLRATFSLADLFKDHSKKVDGDKGSLLDESSSSEESIGDEDNSSGSTGLRVLDVNSVQDIHDVCREGAPLLIMFPSEDGKTSNKLDFQWLIRGS